MSLINRLERRFSRWAIPNLTQILIVGQAALYVASLMPQGISLDRISLDPARVVAGEVWRVATFMLMPPMILPILAVFYFILLNMFGSTLEQQWGAFRYNVFLLIGYLASIVAAFAASFILGQQVVVMPGDAVPMASFAASNSFLYGSIFLAFARLYPDFIMNLFFILPIRIKWLALLMWISFGYALARGDWGVRMMVIASVLNYLVFFGPEHWREFRHGHRRRTFQAQAVRATAAPQHECRVCGLSSDKSPRTPFRYCSQCAGQRCYCPDHIRDHEHVATEEPAAP